MILFIILFHLYIVMDPKRVLFTFLSVYKHGSQLEAAAQLNLTQPAVSQHIKWLESSLNQTLFVKQGRKLLPTTAADHLAHQLEKHVEAIDGIWKSIKSKKQDEFPIHFGCVSEFFAVVIAPQLIALNKANITLIQHQVHPNELALLKQGQLDITQLFYHAVMPGISVVPFFKESFCLVGHPKYKTKLPAKGKQFLNALWKCPWIIYDESLLFIKDYCLQVFDSEFEGHKAHQLANLWSILAAVKEGAGISVIPHYFCEQAIKEKEIVLLYKPPSPPTVKLYLAWREGATSNPTVTKTIEFILNAAKKKSLPFD